MKIKKAWFYVSISIGYCAILMAVSGNLLSVGTGEIVTSEEKSMVMGAVSRPLKYYGVDRVESMDDSNYKILSNNAVKTVVQYLNPAGSTSTFKNLITLSEKYNMNVVIFPGGSDVSGCGWEFPFNNPVNGDYIGKVKPMLDYFNNVANWPGGKIRVVGLVSSHEPMWNQGTCKTSIADMAAIKSQLKAYVSRPDFKVWNYIDNISDISSIKDFSGPADYEKIMDVAAIWQHCFGGAEGSCPGALSKINKDRALLNSAGLDGKVDLVFLMQTFAAGGGYVMPTYDQLLTESQNFINTGALDGFIYYTWGACWYSGDLGCPNSNPKYSNLWPIMKYISDKYISGVVAPIPTSTASLTATKVPTTTPTRVPTITNVPTITKVPTMIPTRAPTATIVPTTIPTRAPTATNVPTRIPTLAAVATSRPTLVPTPVTGTGSISKTTLKIETPAAGMIINRGSVVPIMATWSSNTEIGRIVFLVNNRPICTQDNPAESVTCNWTVPKWGYTGYMITARVYESTSSVMDRVLVRAKGFFW